MWGYTDSRIKRYSTFYKILYTNRYMTGSVFLSRQRRQLNKANEVPRASNLRGPWASDFRFPDRRANDEKKKLISYNLGENVI